MSHPWTPHFPQKIDSTMAATFDSCPQKFYKEYCLGLSSTAISPDLHAGGAFARGIEIARRAFYIDNTAPKACIALATLAMLYYWGDYNPPFTSGTYAQKDIVNTITAMWYYFDQYPLKTDHIRPYYSTKGVPAIEFTFALPMDVAHPETGDPLIYAGRCDMVGFYKKMGAIIDEKTTKQLGNAWVNQWRMRGQFIGYVFAAQEYGFKLNTAIIRSIAIQKTQFKTLEVVEIYPQWLIERWWKQLHFKARAMTAMFELGETFDYSFGDGCTAYGGCSYLDLCTDRDEQRWYDSFEHRVWDPLAQNPTEMSISKLKNLDAIDWEQANA